MKIKKRILVQIADPAGNITAYVLSGAREDDYEGIAEYIMEHGEHDVEQVAFVKGIDAIDMSGMEFCGNAARAFALMSAKGMIDGKPKDEDIVSIPVTVSGRENPAECEVKVKDDYTKAYLPLPKRIKTLKHCDFAPAEGSKVIVMDGIVHIVLPDIEYSEEVFTMVKDALISQFDPEALGVMFLDTKTLNMTPVVYVKNVDSTFVEGSCGSGSAATAYYLSDDLEDGTHSFELKQPRGTILAKSEIEDGEITKLSIEGPVSISDPEMMEVEYEADEQGMAELSSIW